MGSSKNTDIKTKINKKQEARIKIKSEKKLIFFFLRRNIIIKKNISSNNIHIKSQWWVTFQQLNFSYMKSDIHTKLAVINVV